MAVKKQTRKTSSRRNAPNSSSRATTSKTQKNRTVSKPASNNQKSQSKRPSSPKEMYASKLPVYKEDVPRIAIIGGGASSIACAIRVSQLAKQAGLALSVTILESGKRIGRTILQSGNGRCNFSNAYLDIDSYHNSDFVKETLTTLNSSWDYSSSSAVHELLCKVNGIDASSYNNATISWFEQLGLVWAMNDKEEGLLYPQSNKASTLQDILRQKLEDLGVEIACEVLVRSVRKNRVEQGGYQVIFHDGSVCNYDYCVIASGGKSPDTMVEYLQVPFITQEPVLCPMETSGKDIKNLNGIRVSAKLNLIPAKQSCTNAGEMSTQEGQEYARGDYSLLETGAAFVKEVKRELREEDATQTGELLFREYGVSGIAVFNLSRYAIPGDTLQIQLFPELTEGELVALFEQRLQILGSCTLENFMQGVILPQFLPIIFGKKEAQSQAWLHQSDLADIARALKNFELTIEANRNDQSCQLHRGGIPVDTVDSKTMALKSDEGILVLGEALDVDGPCGGYNLHWAFSTGLLAAQTLVGYVADTHSQTAQA